MSVQDPETDPINDVLGMADRLIELSRTERERISKELDSFEELVSADTAQLLATTHS